MLAQVDEEITIFSLLNTVLYILPWSLPYLDVLLNVIVEILEGKV